MQKRKSLENGRPFLWMLWHPHQRLWNWTLVGIIKRVLPVRLVSGPPIFVIIFLDTIFHWVRALIRRAKKLGISRLFTKTKFFQNTSILYFDIGIHKDAKELSLMIDKIPPSLCDSYRAYGFEASKEFFDDAAQALRAKNNVNLTNAALCMAVPEDGKIKLYKGPGEGLGSSVYRNNFDDYEEVRALRFSDWVNSMNLHLGSNICLLRMNIEGSEVDVIKDIVANGLSEHFDGYFGMWDDISKIDMKRDDEFRAFLRDNRIHPFTFNGRDLRFWFRIKCIRYDISTAVQAGVKRLERLEAKSVATCPPVPGSC